MNRQQRRAAQRNAGPQLPTIAATAPVTRLFAAAAQFQNARLFAEAETLYRRVIAEAGPHDRGPTGAQAEAYVNLAAIHIHYGRFDQALDCYLKAIELRPDDRDLHNQFCTMLMVRGQYEAAAAHYGQLVACWPDYALGHNNLAVARLGTGDAAGAIAAVEKALDIASLPESRSLWVKCLQAMPAPPDTAETRALLVRALSEPWGRPSELARHAAILVKRNPSIAACVERARAAAPRLPGATELYGTDGLAALAREPLLRALLENARNSDLELERAMTAMRACLLASVGDGETPPEPMPPKPWPPDVLAFYGALAQQCFINEYIFPCSDAETDAVDRLCGRLARALHNSEPVTSSWLVAIAAYRPLSSLADADSLAARCTTENWPQPLAALVTQQIREPAEERRLRDSIVALTPVDDTVSQLVRDQYEANPYPRWVKAVPVSGVNDIGSRLRAQFPLANFRNTGTAGPVEVLVAGCGTGQQLVDVAQRIAGSRVLAVDLSRASLAYAKRKTTALGIANIEYGQADILHLAALGRSFDVIDCGGVLHHLGDPEQGWRVLVSLLRPDGVMRIALYSENARRHVVAARDLVAATGYGREPADIRRFRQDVLRLPGHHDAKHIIHSTDFFSMSDCRDLVFHVQEHRFTLPRIRDFLAAQGLAFLGFEADHEILRRYDRQFPDDPARADLDRWHRFEQANPAAFSGMYQFWLQKRA